VAVAMQRTPAPPRTYSPPHASYGAEPGPLAASWPEHTYSLFSHSPAPQVAALAPPAALAVESEDGWRALALSRLSPACVLDRGTLFLLPASGSAIEPRTADEPTGYYFFPSRFLAAICAAVVAGLAAGALASRLLALRSVRNREHADIGAGRQLPRASDAELVSREKALAVREAVLAGQELEVAQREKSTNIRLIEAGIEARDVARVEYNQFQEYARMCEDDRQAAFDLVALVRDHARALQESPGRYSPSDDPFSETYSDEPSDRDSEYGTDSESGWTLERAYASDNVSVDLECYSPITLRSRTSSDAAMPPTRPRYSILSERIREPPSGAAPRLLGPECLMTPTTRGSHLRSSSPLPLELRVLQRELRELEMAETERCKSDSTSDTLRVRTQSPHTHTPADNRDASAVEESAPSSIASPLPFGPHGRRLTSGDSAFAQVARTSSDPVGSSPTDSSLSTPLSTPSYTPSEASFPHGGTSIGITAEDLRMFGMAASRLIDC